MQGIWKNNLLSHEKRANNNFFKYEHSSKYNFKRKQKLKHFLKDKRGFILKSFEKFTEIDNRIFKEDFRLQRITKDNVNKYVNKEKTYVFYLDIYKNDRSKKIDSKLELKEKNFKETIKIISLNHPFKISKPEQEIVFNRYNKLEGDLKNLYEEEMNNYMFLDFLNRKKWLFIRENDNTRFVFKKEYEYILRFDYKIQLNEKYTNQEIIEVEDITNSWGFKSKSYYHNINLDKFKLREPNLYSIRKKPYKKMINKQERSKLRQYLNKNNWDTGNHGIMDYEVVSCSCSNKDCVFCVEFIHSLNNLDVGFDRPKSTKSYKWIIL